MNEFLIDTNIYSYAMRAEPAVVSLSLHRVDIYTFPAFPGDTA